MKHKPILMKNRKYEQRPRREIIGLIGTHPGTGVTYTGLMLAFYMGEVLGIKTAFLECNDHQDMNLIHMAYEWEVQDQTHFSFQKVTCYPKVERNHITDILGEDYECVIIDFGTNVIANRDEFLRCSLKFIIAGRSEWDRLKLLTFISNTSHLHGNNNWYYFIPQASEKMVNQLKQQINKNIRSVPPVEDPTIPTYLTNRFFYELFAN